MKPETARRLALAATAPPLNFQPGEEYAASTRRFQGIPGIERLPDGRMFACWYAGGPDEPGEGPGNYVVLVSSEDDGTTWSEPLLIVDHPEHVRAYDPTLWVDPRGRLWLFWAQAYGGYDGRAGVWATVATLDDEDAGREAELIWSAPRRLCDGIMMNKPTVLTSGEWLLPVALWNVFGDKVPVTMVPLKEEPLDEDFPVREHERLAYVVSSIDDGETWEREGGANVAERTFDEHMIVQRADASLWMLVRTRYGIGESTSVDCGRNWSPPRPSGIPHVDARFFIRRLRSGLLLLVTHNPEDGKTRSHLTAWLSDDEGSSWHGGLLLDERQGVSYPDGTQAEDGSIYIIYDRNRTAEREILMAVFKEEDVEAGQWQSEGSRQRVVISKVA